MTPADITALRADACKVFAELGQALACLEDAEGLMDSEGLATLATQGEIGRHASAACSYLAHERMQTACNALETAATTLADLCVTADRLTTQLAPQGVQP